MEKNDVQRLLDKHGSIGAAAKAAGVDYARFRYWVSTGKISDDGLLRCWLALHPKGPRLLMEFQHERDRRAIRGAL